MKRLFLAFVLACGAGSYSLSASPADDKKLAAGNNDFAFNLLKQISYRQSSANIFISPYSASTALQMVGSGAGGLTKVEMDQVLGTEGLSAKSLGEANKAIASSLNGLNNQVILTTANAVWYRHDAIINPDFLNLNRHYFGSTIEPIDFADPHCVDIINTWASEKTQGRISSIADGMIDPKSQLFLANAVYFKGKWEDPFRPAENQVRPFHLHGGRDKTVSMMTKYRKFNYQETVGYQAVRLPYAGGNLAMYVFLPATNSSLDQLIQFVNGEKWRYSIKPVFKPGFSERVGLLALPKFKLEYQVKLVSPLKSMGMKMAFDLNKADLSGIGPQLYISDVVQKTFVEVNEEGTEAAAFTGLNVLPASVSVQPPNPFQMIVDRPFMFLIEDNQTGTILFMGLIHDPEAD